MLRAHPHEEVAYDLISLNSHSYIGSGMIEKLRKLKQLIFRLQKHIHLFLIRHSTTMKIKTVAICGGSGSFLLPQAIRKNADIYITSDFKYEFFNRSLSNC